MLLVACTQHEQVQAHPLDVESSEHSQQWARGCGDVDDLELVGGESPWLPVARVVEARKSLTSAMLDFVVEDPLVME